MNYLFNWNSQIVWFFFQIYPLGELFEEAALAVLDGEFGYFEVMTLVVLPLGLLLMAAAVIGLPIYLAWLILELPTIIHCFGRMDRPKDYPECYDTSRRSLNRFKFPECHPTCHLEYLAKQNQIVAVEGNQGLPNIGPNNGSFDLWIGNFQHHHKKKQILTEKKNLWSRRPYWW